MAYAILRVAKLKTAGNIGGVNAHLTRTMNVPNADPELSKFNSRPIGSSDILGDVKARLEEAGITKPRKDAVLAVEHLMTASSEHFGAEVRKGANGEKELWLRAKQWKEFEKASIEWLQERYGAKNVVNVTVHKDEQTPHIHAIVVPIDSKGKLNCKSFLGGREKLRDMQSSFADKMQPYGLERGVEGSKAHHQEVKHFYGHVKDYNKEIPPLHIELVRPAIEVKPLKTGFLGIGGDNPVFDAESQTFRINTQIYDAEVENQKKITERFQELKQAISESKAIKEKNKAFEGQIEGLKNTVKAMEDKVKALESSLEKKDINSKRLIHAIASGGIKPEELKNAIEKIPARGDQRQEMLRGILKETGIPIKQEEQIIQQKKSRGIGR